MKQSFSKASQQQRIKEEHRRKQNDMTLRILRVQLCNLSPEQAKEKVLCNMDELRYLIHNIQNLDNAQRQRIRIILKQLKQISCNNLVPATFCIPQNISILIEIHNKAGRQILLDDYSIDFVHTILVNISGNNDNESNPKLNVQQLSFHYLGSNKINTIQLVLIICGNILKLDQNSSTIYYLINKSKSDVISKLVEFLINHPESYQYIESTVLWFVRLLLINIYRYKFQNLNNCYEDMIKIIFKNIRNKIIDTVESVHVRSKDSIEYHGASVNELLTTMKICLKSELIEFDNEIIQALQSELFFKPSNYYFIDLMVSLSFLTCFTIKPYHMKLLLQELFNKNHNFSDNIIRLISNSLINDNFCWKIVSDWFIKKAHCQQFDDIVEHQRFVNTAFFVYFLNDPKKQYDICEIIGVIVYSQGGLGYFQQCLEQLAMSEFGRLKLQSFGIQC